MEKNKIITKIQKELARTRYSNNLPLALDSHCAILDLIINLEINWQIKMIDWIQKNFSFHSIDFSTYNKDSMYCILEYMTILIRNNNTDFSKHFKIIYHLLMNKRLINRLEEEKTALVDVAARFHDSDNKEDTIKYLYCMQSCLKESSETIEEVMAHQQKIAEEREKIFFSENYLM